MRVSAKADYAVRALVELAAVGDVSVPVPAERLADAQQIPVRFLLGILGELRTAGLVRSRRGPGGGYLLARRADTITIADVLRAIEGPLAHVGDARPDELDYPGPAASLRDVWVALRASLREVLETVTLADVAAGTLPAAVLDRTANEQAWQPATG